MRGRNRVIKLIMVTLGAGLLLSFCLTAGTAVIAIALVLIVLGLLMQN